MAAIQDGHHADTEDGKPNTMQTVIEWLAIIALILATLCMLAWLIWRR